MIKTLSNNLEEEKENLNNVTKLLKEVDMELLNNDLDFDFRLLEIEHSVVK